MLKGPGETRCQIKCSFGIHAARPRQWWCSFIKFRRWSSWWRVLRPRHCCAFPMRRHTPDVRKVASPGLGLDKAAVRVEHVLYCRADEDCLSEEDVLEPVRGHERDVFMGRHCVAQNVQKIQVSGCCSASFQRRMGGRGACCCAMVAPGGGRG